MQTFTLRRPLFPCPPLLLLLLLLSLPAPCHSTTTTTSTLRHSLHAILGLPTLSADCGGSAKCERMNACLRVATNAQERAACAVDCTGVASGPELAKCTETRSCIGKAADETNRLQCVCKFVPEVDKPECGRTTICAAKNPDPIEKQLCGIDCIRSSPKMDPEKLFRCEKIRRCLQATAGDAASQERCFTTKFSLSDTYALDNTGGGGGGGAGGRSGGGVDHSNIDSLLVKASSKT